MPWSIRRRGGQLPRGQGPSDSTIQPARTIGKIAQVALKLETHQIYDSSDPRSDVPGTNPSGIAGSNASRSARERHISVVQPFPIGINSDGRPDIEVFTSASLAGGAELLTIGHPGLGLVVVRQRVRLSPVIVTGSAEHGCRPTREMLSGRRVNQDNFEELEGEWPSGFGVFLVITHPRIVPDAAGAEARSARRNGVDAVRSARRSIS